MKATISSTRSRSTLSRILVRRTSAQPRSAPDVLMLAPPLSEVSAPHVEPLRKSLESSRGNLFDTICMLDSWAYVRRSLPVGCPSKGTTISSRGPADACTTGITPAALLEGKSQFATSANSVGERTMNSTTLIPKCSSTIVLIPMLARDNQLSISG